MGKKYAYFVYYKDEHGGFGRARVFTSTKAKSLGWVENVEALLQSHLGIKGGAVICNWKRLKNDDFVESIEDLELASNLVQ